MSYAAFRLLDRALVAVLLLSSGNLLCAQEMKMEDLKAEIVPNCILAVGEWGTDMVQICVEREVAALEAVMQHRTRARGSVGRCTDRWKRSGWAEVRACVENDLAAAAALEEYGEQHAALVARCRAERSNEGPAAVRGCVDDALAAGQPKP